MDRPDSMCLGMRLELVQDPAAHSKAARRFDDPHTLQLGGVFSVELECAAADRVCMEGGDEEETGGGGALPLRRVGGLCGGLGPFLSGGPRPLKMTAGKTGGWGGGGRSGRLWQLRRA